MHKTWFHNCITGMLALSEVRKTDLDAFLTRHPSQANVHFLSALKDLRERKSLANSAHPFHLPDRKALWLLRNEGPAAPAVAVVGDEPSTVAVHASHRNDNSNGAKALPVYVPVAVAEEVADHDDEIAGLEERLLARLEEEIEEEIFEEDTPEATDIRAAAANTPPPMLERFDMQIGPAHFGRPVAEAKQSEFVNWLSSLSSTGPTLADYEAEQLGTEADEEDSVPLKERKQKKGGKKKAKQLARKSIKPDKNVATETLARILTDQGHFEEAITMYERLRLLIPEKSAIFAVQIQNLKEKLK